MLAINDNVSLGCDNSQPSLIKSPGNDRSPRLGQYCWSNSLNSVLHLVSHSIVEGHVFWCLTRNRSAILARPLTHALRQALDYRIICGGMDGCEGAIDIFDL